MNCRICNDKGLIYYITSGKWKLFKCCHCGFIQVSEEPTEQELQKIYSYSYFSDSKYKDLNTLHKEYNFRLNLMRNYISESSNVLDYGCAKADFINFGISKYNFYGIDYSIEAINEAKKINNTISTNLFYINELDKIEDNSLDCILLWDVIEHLWSPQKTMQQLIPKLKTNGHILISTPKINSIFARLTKQFWPFMTPPEHLSFLSAKSIELLASYNNLQVLDIKSKGKWVNVGFLFYKLKRIFPKFIPNVCIKVFSYKFTSNLAVYVPTNDIQYIVLKKN